MKSSQLFWVLIFALFVFSGCGGSSGGGGVVPPPNPSLTISLAAQPNGALNLPFDFQFTVANGLQPLTWMETGALPAGLNFDADGDLAGTPTEVGSFPITVTVHDSAGHTATPAGFTVQIFTHGFQATGDMGTERAAHTATLLPNGNVLITGGFNNTAVLATAELFDPATGTFTPTGDMTSPRFAHTATLLQNGKVLIAGGSPSLGDLSGGDDTDDLPTAEIFDPTTGTFTATGTMSNRRSQHAATLLASGKVLLTGGTVGNAAELFDPATGSFTATTGELIVGGRWGCTATLLKDGTVLIAGGRDDEDVFDGLPLNDAEIFDPATETFAATASMTEFRYGHTATLLNSGKVLLAGGTNGNSLSDAELFDPTTGTFSATSPMSFPRAQHTATLLNDGTVLVAGGFSFFPAPGGGFPYVDIFDPATNTFTSVDPLETGRYGHTATRLNNGQVLITGGGANNPGLTQLKSAEIYK